MVTGFKLWPNSTVYEVDLKTDIATRPLDITTSHPSHLYSILIMTHQSSQCPDFKLSYSHFAIYLLRCQLTNHNYNGNLLIFELINEIDNFFVYLKLFYMDNNFIEDKFEEFCLRDQNWIWNFYFYMQHHWNPAKPATILYHQHPAKSATRIPCYS